MSLADLLRLRLKGLFRPLPVPAPSSSTVAVAAPATEASEPATAAPQPAPATSTYDDRVRQEIELFRSGELQVNELPEIFSYWSNKYLRCSLEQLGFSNPIEFFAQQIERSPLKPGGVIEIVSLGAGNCDIEVAIAQILVAKGFHTFSIHCIDLTNAMLDRGAALASESGLIEHFSFEEADLNTWVPAREYPVVIANQCLHHVENLEHLFEAVQKAIGADGVFVTSDMIGRNGHQRWPEALAVLQEFWKELPDEYRYNVLLKRQETEFLDWDCSTHGFEGVRAQDILPLAIERFGFTVFYAFGNVVTPFIDRCFGHHFSSEREWDRDFIDRVHARDEEEILLGTIKPTQMLAVMVNDRAAIPQVWRHLTPEFCVRPTA